MIYENGSLKRILVEGGYIENGIYHFYLQDHLKNNRVVAKADGTVIQANHYYPFGMSFAESTYPDKQPYKYNGKELDTQNGLNLYDYGARWKDFGFTTIDPLAEKYYNLSPYAYCLNNPVNSIDLYGLWAQSASGWYTNNAKDIERFYSMMQIENTMQGGIGKEQIDNFIFDEYKGVGGKLSDGSVLLSAVDVSKNQQEEWYIAENQKMELLNEIDRYGSLLLNDYDRHQQIAGYSGNWGHIVGPALILLGQPVRALKPIGALGSKPGSSIASYTLSKALPQRFTNVFGKKIGTKIASKIGTNTIGRALGRFVPYVGWGITITTTSFSLGEKYGPSTWYGDNDYKWFE